MIRCQTYGTDVISTLLALLKIQLQVVLCCFLNGTAEDEVMMIPVSTADENVIHDCCGPINAFQCFTHYSLEYFRDALDSEE